MRKYFETFCYSPFACDLKLEHKPAIALYTEVLQRVIDNFSQEKALGKFSSVPLYMNCIDVAMGDILQQEKNVTESEYRRMALEYELTEEKDA